MFAIKKIKKGTALFSGDNEEMLWIDEPSVPNAPGESRKLYDDFSVIKDKRYGCPQSFNRLTMAWYLNEPGKHEKPNVACDPDSFDFFAIRNIEVGQELTVDYSKCSELPRSLPKKRSMRMGLR